MHPATDARGVLYRGGSILTVDAARPRADAVATRAGTIVAVGSEEDCRRALGMSDAAGTADADLYGDTPAVVDLGGQALLPGFVDAQIHPFVMAFYAHRLDLSRCRSIPELLDALADRARITPPGEWVVGLKLCAGNIDEGRLPTIAELDEVGAGRPVVLIGADGHSSIGNTVALAAAGIRGNRENPPGGVFERDERGRLTGVCRETATRILLSTVPVPDLDELRAVILQIFADLASRGITSVSSVLQTDAEGPAGPAGALQSVGMMILVEDVPLGSHAILCGDPNRAVDARISSALHKPEQNRLVGGIKMFLDGTLDGHTASLHHPYGDNPSKLGFLTLDVDVARDRMEAAHLAGLQICVQAIGDAANTAALDLFADLLARHPGDRARHRIEHASILDEGAAERFADLGITAVVQPLLLETQGPWLARRVGPDRARRTYPLRSLVDAGAVVAGSSDAPLTDPDVLAAMAAAVHRHGFQPEQALSAEEAVEMYTLGGAKAQQRDHVAGRLAEGLRADLVVLSDDPTAVPAEQIADISVTLTVVGGRVVHRMGL